VDLLSAALSRFNAQVFNQNQGVNKCKVLWRTPQWQRQSDVGFWWLGRINRSQTINLPLGK